MLGLSHPTDILMLCAAVASLTMLVSLGLNKLFTGWDERILMWFSAVASSPKWSVIWVLIFLAWLPIRELLVAHWKWFSADGDLLVLTMLWSVGPYMVENAMKYSTARQMEALQKQSERIDKQTVTLTDLVTAVRSQLERSEERDDLLHEMVAKLLDAIEENPLVAELVKEIRHHLGETVGAIDARLRELVVRLLNAIDGGAA